MAILEQAAAYNEQCNKIRTIVRTLQQHNGTAQRIVTVHGGKFCSRMKIIIFRASGLARKVERKRKIAFSSKQITFQLFIDFILYRYRCE